MALVAVSPSQIDARANLKCTLMPEKLDHLSIRLPYAERMAVAHRGAGTHRNVVPKNKKKAKHRSDECFRRLPEHAEAVYNVHSVNNIATSLDEHYSCVGFQPIVALLILSLLLLLLLLLLFFIFLFLIPSVP